MTEQDFLEIVQITKMLPKNREALRLHFLEGKAKGVACDEAGVKRQRMTELLTSFENASLVWKNSKESNSATLDLPAGLSAVLAVNASFAVAVKNARERFGDEASIVEPKSGEKSIGEIIGRTDFHLVQSVGRGKVAIHELAKLDRVPQQGKMVTIEYQNDRGVVADRAREPQRGISR